MNKLFISKKERASINIAINSLRHLLKEKRCMALDYYERGIEYKAFLYETGINRYEDAVKDLENISERFNK